MRHSKVMSLAGHTALYGGSFNPPHMGHQMACLYLLEGMAAETVWLVPAVHHPFHKKLVDFERRVEMCQILASAFGPGRVEICSAEASEGASGRTYDTLLSLKSQHPDRRFALAVGSDIMGETSQWHRWQDIVAMVQVAVIGRAGYPNDQAWPVELPAISSGEIRRYVSEGRTIEGLVPAGVAEYIERFDLYRD